MDALPFRAGWLCALFVSLMLFAGTGSVQAQDAPTPRSEEIRSVLLKADADPQIGFVLKREGVREQVQSRLDQEGRYELLFATTILGLAEGLLIPAAVDTDNDDAYAAGALAGASLGFFVPLLLTRNAEVTEAAGTMATYGTLQGLAHGGLLSAVLFGDDLEGQESVAAGITAGLAAGETLIAYRLANRLDLRAGTAETIGYGSFAGAFVSGTLTSVVTGEGASRDVSDDVYARSHAAAILGGTVAGSYLGYRLARADDFTQGDARVWGLAGVLTTQAAGAGLLLAEEEGTRTVPAVLAAGAVGGLTAGRLLLRNRDFTTGQANIMALGSLAGSLLGSAIAVTADASEETGVALSAAGSLVGFGATYATYADEARTRTAFGWQVEVNPYALYGSLSSDQVDPVTAPTAFTLRRTF